MLLLGGYDYESESAQSGIWELKEEKWSRIGELSQVWKNIFIKNSILVFQPARSGSVIYINRSIYFFEYYRSIYRIDLTENEELKAVEKIGNQPGNYYYPVLYQTENDYCV